MHKVALPVAVLLGILFGALALLWVPDARAQEVQQEIQEDASGGFVPGEVLVKTEDGYDVVSVPGADTLAEVEAKAEDLEAEPTVLEAGANYVYELQQGFSIREPAPGPDVGEPDPDIALDASASGLDPTPNDNYYTATALQDNLKLERFSAGWARTHGTRSGAAVEVAVLDEGIYAAHPDLDSKIAAQQDFIDGDPDASEVPGGYHGTFVSGIAAAETNTDPAAGMAGAGWDVKLDVARVCGPDTCEEKHIAPAIAWAVAQGARVINLSFGGVRASGGDSAVNAEIQNALNKNRIVVAAVGNEGITTNNFWPASYPGVLGVGAVRSDNAPSEYSIGASNAGDMVDLVAIDSIVTPSGVQGIVSTSNPGALADCESSNCYAPGRGTSYATPQVSGAAALLWAHIDAPTDEKVRARLMNNATNLGAAGRDDQFGHGRLNVKCAFTPTAKGC